MHPSDPLRTYVAHRAERLRGLLEPLLGARVILSLDGFENVADVTVEAGGLTHSARETSNADIYAAVDLAIDKLAAQLRGSEGPRPS